MKAASARARTQRKTKTTAKRRRKTTPGPKPSITLQVVKRVSERVGRGVTLRLSLAAENLSTINEETWKKALAAHPEFSPHYEAAKGKFIDLAVRRLAQHKDAKFLCWLLERRHGDLFAKPEPATTVNVSQQVSVGIPEDVLRRAKELQGPKDQASLVKSTTEAGGTDAK